MEGGYRGPPPIWYTRELGSVVADVSGWRKATEEDASHITQALAGGETDGVVVDFSSSTLRNANQSSPPATKDFLMLAREEIVKLAEEEETVALLDQDKSEVHSLLPLSDNAKAAIYFIRRHAVPTFTLFDLHSDQALLINLDAATILNQTQRTVLHFQTKTDPLASYLRKCYNMPITTQMLGKMAAREFRYRGHPYDPAHSPHLGQGATE